MENRDVLPGREEIAVIGMAGRFPGARDLDQFWENLCQGVESIRSFTREELAASGIDPAVMDQTGYVNAGVVLEEAECFDADFFGYHPREAELMDPQHRVFLECAWAALEHAGYDSERYAGLIGVFGGVARNSYLLQNLAPRRELAHTLASHAGVLANDKDFPATRVSFKLNLHGPSLNVQTACSSSGVAVHLACQSLLGGECDLALAGGARIRVPMRAGYHYEEGGILSPDGHCRAFDAQARGTVLGSGAAIVVLKRLSDAVRDGDCIYAIIKGSAINNDGASKVGFTAPSVSGQARVIAEAQVVAGVNAATIGYVEAHGTGTSLGDPIEIAALTQAFRQTTHQRNYCAIGSLKPNIGHLDAGAGAAGLIKAVLALKNRQLPPSINFERPNPQIDFANSPFYVNSRLAEWPEGSTPRRGAVSSFGLGGTNAHIILEEAPAVEPSGPSRSRQLILLSGKTRSALDRATANFAAYLEKHPEMNLADAAYTLQVGRRPFSHRRMLVCADRSDALEALRQPASPRVVTKEADRREPSVIFMLPGQGTQEVYMGAELYRTEPVFREAMDHCCETLKPQLGLDLRDILYPPESQLEEARRQLHRTLLAQPALFVVEYAFARLWLEWGVRPAAMIGHSVGEYVAACLAEVLTVEDALALLAARGRLMQDLPGGVMLAVHLPEAEVRSYLGTELSLAAVNAASRCVISGPPEAVVAVEAQFAAKRIACRRLQTSHAFHSAMMDPVLAPYTARVREVRLNPPRIPYISSVTGTWITPAEATDPAYWALHLRGTVRFADGLQEVLRESGRVLLEVGPGEVLTGLARQARRTAPEQSVLASAPPVQSGANATAFLLNTLGRLWLAGVTVDWTAFSRHERRHRVPLPTYPFERKRFWIDPLKAELLSHVASPAASAEPPASIPEESLPSVAAVPLLTLPARGKGNGHAASRQTRVLDGLKDVLRELSGADVTSVDAEATFLSLGFDSLFLTQAGISFQKKFGVPVTLRHLMEEHPSLQALATYIEAQMPAEAEAEADHVPAPVATAVATPEPAVPRAAAAQPAGNSAIERIITQQLAVMTEQLAMLRAANASEQPSLTPVTAPSRLDPTSTPGSGQGSLLARTALLVALDGPKAEGKAFGPFKPVEKSRNRPLSAEQQKALNELIARYTRRTGKSKRLAQQHRAHFADPRSISGFRLDWKEMVYPIVVARAAGSKLWDVDGNEYIDFTMGFGVNLFGHSPEFVTRAVAEQLQQGFPIGPQTPLAGAVAEKMREFSGLDRVSFCNTGSEAVLAALRVARTVTGRNRVALFAGSYHGINDEVLGRPNPLESTGRPMPIAPGILPNTLENVLVLDYGQPSSLEKLKAHSDDLAAVLVEPVQSRRPDLQPKDFLQALREMTARTGTALIFDEIVTGFRLHQRGAQAWYGVPADIATYGKVIGGGLPLGMIAGRARFMDAFDGGAWQYGDESYPGVGVTFFAGTFVRHPLALAAAAATLRHVQESGPGLQEQLNARGSRLAQALAALFTDHQVPIRVLNCGSMFHFVFDEDRGWARLLFFYLRMKGIHVLDGRPCFLSAAHSEDDIACILQAFRESVAEMKESGFLPGNASVVRAPAAVRTGNGHSHTARRLPLTPAQMEIWLETQKSTAASSRFNESNSLRLRGPFNPDAMRQALQLLVARHEALRTVFSSAGDHQEILPSLTLDVPLVDLSGMEIGEREKRIAELQHCETQVPFDLERGPLLRAQILRLESQLHLLLLTQHHINVDGWSLAILLKELGELYSSAVRGADPALAKPMQFSEYAEWLTHPEQCAAASTAETYWLKKFADSVPVLDLPTDQQRTAKKAVHSARVVHTVPASVYEHLKRLGAGQNASFFATLLAGFALWLHRVSGQEDVVVGIPAAHQALAGGQGLVGHCTHLLPVRSRFTSTQKFTEFLALTKRELTDAMDHQSCTFGTILRQLRIPRDPCRVPLVSVTFNLDRVVTGLSFAGLELDITPNPKSHINFDLIVNARDTGRDLRVECDFDAGLFNPETIQRWLGYWEAMLAGLADDPDQTLASVPMLTTEERHRVLVEWNHTQTAYPKDKSVARLFEEQVERTPDQVAVVFGDRSLSYRDLNGQANRLAHYLRKRNVEPGMNVGVFLDRSPELIVGLIAILKAGAAYVPIDTSYPAERIAFILEDTQTPVILTHSSLLSRLSTTRSRVAALSVDAEWEGIIQENAANPLECATGESLAYIIYTSGSTGKPKGVSVPHRAINRLLFNTNYIQLERSDRIAQVSNSAFDAATFEIWGALLHGATLVGIGQDITLSPRDFAAALAKERVTTLFLTTALFNQIATHEPRAFRSLKHLLFGGEAVDASAVRTVLKEGPPQHLLHVYGPTESTTFASWHEVKAVPAAAATVPIGRPLSNTQLFVLDRQRQPVPIGMAGELYIGGDGLALGYFNRPALTAEKFVASPFAAGARLYRTGDLVRMLPDGNIEFIGRTDHQVKIRGFRIELEEIESLLKQHESVRDAIVVVREASAGDKRLAAYLVMKEPAKAATVDWREFLRQKVPDYMVPATCVELEHFPLTPHGKVDRAALPAPGPARLESQPPSAPPRNSEERQLTEIWETILEVRPIGIDEKFFDLGGHSLLAVRLFAEIEKVFGRRLPLSSLFEAPTIRQLAERIRPAESAREDSSVIAIQPSGSRPPLFLLPGAGGGLLWGYANLAQYLGSDQPVFGFQSRAAVEGEDFMRIEDMAAHYLTDMRKVQPTGPYHLGGYCFGGDVAYEMACKLKAQGERVGLLALIDSTPPGFDNEPVQWWHPGFVPALARNSSVALLDFIRSTPADRRDYFRRKLRMLKNKLASSRQHSESAENRLDLEEIIDISQFPEHELKLWEKHLRALRAYVPRPYAGRVTLFRTRRQPLGSMDSTLGWGKLAESVTVEVIPGSHEKIFLEPNVQRLAQFLQFALDSAAGRTARNLERDPLASDKTGPAQAVFVGEAS